ncbi:MAG: response regulator transcription factor [Romboutsia timonensis]|uniref:response regulator transcription factor n=1 Tax=Romboutsia timonensis TaxID=1776391 RepID=UPI002A75594F|nr:response regulator transcription factor [Romboutsia timonensis]MDY3000214.1 response regulator transcription factor [Romboutsia timonensis]
MKILVVSESFIIRDSLNHLLNETLKTNDIITASNANDLSNEDLLEIDFSLIDVNKNNISIVERLSKVKNKSKKLKIMILDMRKDIELFIKSIDYGIDGYILNIDDKDEFIYIIKKVLNGKKFYDSELLQYTIHNEKTNNEIDLTNREKCVLNYVCKGLSNKDIANELKVTDYTIKKHVSNILSKLHLRNRQDIILYAQDNNIIDDII